MIDLSLVVALCAIAIIIVIFVLLYLDVQPIRRWIKYGNKYDEVGIRWVNSPDAKTSPTTRTLVVYTKEPVYGAQLGADVKLEVNGFGKKAYLPNKSDDLDFLKVVNNSNWVVWKAYEMDVRNSVETPYPLRYLYHLRPKTDKDMPGTWSDRHITHIYNPKITKKLDS